jgi:hypothetical protein
MEQPAETVYQNKEISEPQIRPPRPFQGNIVMLNGASFICMVRKGRLTVFKASLYDINKAIEVKDLKECPLEEIVPDQYHEFLPLFNKVLADRLPPHRSGIDHNGRLKERVTPTSGPLYSMSRAEFIVLKEWLQEIMLKGFIQQSSSLCAAPVLFTKEPGGVLRFCIDY